MKVEVDIPTPLGLPVVVQKLVVLSLLAGAITAVWASVSATQDILQNNQGGESDSLRIRSGISIALSAALLILVSIALVRKLLTI